MEGTYEDPVMTNGFDLLYNQKNKINKRIWIPMEIRNVCSIGLVLLLQQYILLENRKIYLALHLS
jgi:hypothetical protein